MGKKSMKWYSWLAAIVATIVAVAIGSLFIGGSFASTMLLGWIPAMGQTIIGWVIIVIGVLGLIFKMTKSI